VHYIERFQREARVCCGSPTSMLASARGGGIQIERVFAAAAVLILPGAARIEFAAAPIASR